MGPSYFLLAMDYFTEWLEFYAIPNQEAETVTDVLVANFFCHIWVPSALHSDQGQNSESQLLWQEVLQCLRVCKMRITPLKPQLDETVECYVKRAEKHPRQVISAQQRDWDERLPLLLIAYRASTHKTAGTMPTSMMFGWEIGLSFNLLFGAAPDKDQSTNDHMTDLI
jgi:hypothetical protein